MPDIHPSTLRAVNDSRVELGLDPLTAAFGINLPFGGLGWRGMSRAERSAKAKKQLRDRFGRFAEMGGHMAWKDRNGTQQPGRFLGVTDGGDVLVGDTANSRIRRIRPEDVRVIKAEATLPEKNDNPLGSPFDLNGDGTVEPEEIRRRLSRVEGKPYALDKEPEPSPPPEGDVRLEIEEFLKRRPAKVFTSMSALTQQGKEFVNNGGGTMDDPVHTATWKNGRSLSVRQSDLQKHFEEILDAAINEGKPFHPKQTPEALARARNWYRDAHQIALDILAEYPDSGLTLEQVTGVLAALSPRKVWDVWTVDKEGNRNRAGNIADAKKVIDAFLNKVVDGVPLRDMPIEDAKKLTKGGFHSHVATALQILHDPAAMEQGVLTGTKRRSFWNNLFDPENRYDATMDGWMASAIWRMGGTYSDGTPVDNGALKWVDHRKVLNKRILVPGAGYVILADALRGAAAKYGLTPSEAQAIYWTSVGGGAKGTQMWSMQPKVTAPRKKAAPKKRKPRKRPPRKRAPRPVTSSGQAMGGLNGDSGTRRRWRGMDRLR
jgi:hypothetical protein